MSPSRPIIAQGVLPPLSASANSPLAATASRPTAAIISAAKREAASASGRILVSIAIGIGSGGREPLGSLLVMATELFAHRRQHFVAKIVETARVETLVERRSQHRRRHSLVDRGD